MSTKLNRQQMYLEAGFTFPHSHQIASFMIEESKKRYKGGGISHLFLNMSPGEAINFRYR